MNLQSMKIREIARPTGNKLIVNFSLDTLSSTGLLKTMIIEIIICSLHSPPFVNAIFIIPNARDDVPYSLDIILTLFVIMRIYLFWRVFMGESFWNDERAEQICREICNTQGGGMFTLKSELKERPYIIIMFTMVMIIFVFGFAIRSAEL